MASSAFPSPEQTRVLDWVSSGSGHGLVRAVAGSGKTTTIVEAARRIPAGQSALFCAFNASIRDVLESRLNERVTCRTMHALGLETLNRSKLHKKRFRLLDGKTKSMADQMMRELLHEKASREQWRNSLMSQIASERLDHSKQLDPSIQEVAIGVGDGIARYVPMTAEARATNPLIEDLADWQLRRIIRELLAEMTRLIQLHLTPVYKRSAVWGLAEHHGLTIQRELQKLLFRPLSDLLIASEQEAVKYGQISFEEMIYLPLEWNLPIAQSDWVFVDECQDLSPAQLELVTRACRPRGRMLLVGDEWQAIYGFAGADPQSVERAREKLQPEELPLSHTFRCDRAIVEHARTVCENGRAALQIKHPVEITPRPQAGPGNVEQIALDEYRRQVKIGDTVLARRNAPLLTAILEVRQQGMPAIWQGREALRDIMDALERAANIPGFRWADCSDFVHAAWHEAIAELPPFAQAQDAIDDHYSCLLRCLEFLGPNCASVEEFADRLIEVLAEKPENGVRFSTMHRIKGLEAPKVYILDLGDIPMDRVGMPHWQRVQEVHLQYVAITRAMNELYWVRGPEVKESYGTLSADQAQRPGPLPCPTCQSAMVLRRSPAGPFWGCVRFPSCQGSRLFELHDSCPNCRKPLVLRAATSGQNKGQFFEGCSGYPACKYIASRRGKIRMPQVPLEGLACPDCGNSIIQITTKTGGRFQACQELSCGWRGSKGIASSRH